MSKYNIWCVWELWYIKETTWILWWKQTKIIHTTTDAREAFETFKYYEYYKPRCLL